MKAPAIFSFISFPSPAADRSPKRENKKQDPHTSIYPSIHHTAATGAAAAAIPGPPPPRAWMTLAAALRHRGIVHRGPPGGTPVRAASSCAARRRACASCVAWSRRLLRVGRGFGRRCRRCRVVSVACVDDINIDINSLSIIRFKCYSSDPPPRARPRSARGSRAPAPAFRGRSGRPPRP